MLSKPPTGNVWNLRDNDSKSVNCGKNFRFCFDEFNKPEIRKLIKLYVWHNYHVGSIAVRSVYEHFSDMKKFQIFAEENNIESISELTTNDIDDFMTFLKLNISDKTGQKLGYQRQAGLLSALKTIIYWGQMYAPELVPDKEIFIGNEYTMTNRKHKIEFIPDDVVKQIYEALKTEENPYIKYGIIILFSTGMRRSELLNLEVGCVSSHLLKGDTLTMYDFKNRKQYRKIPIPPICSEAIRNLTEVTADLRELADESIKKYLFLQKTSKCGIANEIKVISGSSFRNWINGYPQRGKYYEGFMDRHNIVGPDGEIYKVKLHQFRKTVATDMFSKNVDLKVIQEFLRHAHPETTKKYYADSKDIDRANIFKRVNIIGNINDITIEDVGNTQELDWFNRNKQTKAKMCDGYCTMPIVNGQVCERLKAHQKCYTCSRYITTPEYLQAHKEHLLELEAELANNIYGSHYAAHLEPTIAILKEIIERLEDIDNDK